MNYLSLFSGIEGASVAWNPKGWKCVGVSEIEQFPCAVLKYRFPDVPNLGDINQITQAQIEALGPIDIVIFGSPCQDFSLAGKRKGLKNADGTVTRSGLFFKASTIAGWSKARFTVVENVPGLFTSNGGRDFADVVGELAGADINVPGSGWSNTGVALGPKGLVEWTVLDAQWFGLAQRRERVFIVRDAGDWANRPPLLFNKSSLQGHSAPSRKARKGIADSLETSLGGSSIPDIAGCLQERDSKGSDSDTKPGHLIPVSIRLAQTGSNGWGVNEQGIAYTLDSQQQAVAFQQNQLGEIRESENVFGTLTQNGNASGRNTPMLKQKLQVRRLIPVECERLQGFPDGFSLIPYRNGMSKDGPRYKALGNSFAVPVIRWIGEQIERVIDEK